MTGVADKDRLDVALIGLGGVSEPHLLAYRALPSIRIVGVVEPRSERLAEICTRYGVRGYESLQALLKERTPHVACILTPAATHRALTEQCAAAGVHVLCEKPMAVTLEDACAMESACKNAGVHFFYGSSYRFLPAVQKAKSLIEGGAIGEIRLMFESLLGGGGTRAYRPLAPAHYPEGGPGGGGAGLVDHGIHLLDVFPWLNGTAITSVLGRGDRTGAQPRPEFALLCMRGGAMGMLAYDSSTRPTTLPWEGVFSEGRQWINGQGWTGEHGHWEEGAGSIHVYGAEGSLRIFHYANKLFINQTGEPREVLVPLGTTPDHFGLQITRFHEDLQAKRPAATSAQDGIRALKALHALYESEKSGHWEPVASEP